MPVGPTHCPQAVENEQEVNNMILTGYLIDSLKEFLCES